MPNTRTGIEWRAGASNPFRLDRLQVVTPDQGHGYLQEQQAFDHGLMDLFPQFTSNPGGSREVMGYYDGNTVTAMWNYAQSFAMSDNSYSTTFGPSTPEFSGFKFGLKFSNAESYPLTEGVLADGLKTGSPAGLVALR